MKIVACVANVPDPETAPLQRSIAVSGATFEAWSGSFSIGPFDSNALELGLQIRDRTHGTLTAMSVGGPEAAAVLRKALSVTADAVLWIEQSQEHVDAAAVSQLLSAAIRARGGADLVLCGRQGGSWDSGQVGPRLARELGIDHIGLVRTVDEVDDAKIVITREVETGLRSYECSLPCLIIATNDRGNQLRAARVRDVMQASTAKIATLSAAALGIVPSIPAAAVVKDVRPFQSRSKSVEQIGGPIGAQVSELADCIEAMVGCV